MKKRRAFHSHVCDLCHKNRFRTVSKGKIYKCRKCGVIREQDKPEESKE